MYLDFQVNLLNKLSGKMVAIVLGCLGLLLLILSAGFKVDLSPWRDTLEDIANESLPYHLSLPGKLEARVGFRPSIEITNLQLSPENDLQNPIISAGLVSAKVGVLSLLRNKISIDHILMDSVMVQLVSTEEGNGNWEVSSNTTPEDTETEEIATTTPEQPLPEPSSSPREFDLAIDQEISVTNLFVEYQDQQQDINLEAEINAMVLALDDHDRLKLSAEGSLLGEDWLLSAKAPFASLLGTEDGELELSATLADVRLSAEGLIQHGKGRFSELDISADFPAAPLVAELFNEDIARLTPISAVSVVHFTTDELHIKDLQVLLAGSDLSGDLILKNQQPTQISGSLVMNEFDLTPWLELAEQTEESTPEIEAEVLAEEEIPEENNLPELLHNWLKQAEIDTQLSIKKISGLPLNVEDVQFDIEMAPSLLKTPVSIKLEGVALQGLMKTSVKEDKIDASVEFSAGQSDIGPLFSALTENDIKGHINQFNLQLTTSGETPSQLIRNASLYFEMNDGSLQFEDEQNFAIQTAEARLGFTQNTQLKLVGELLDIPVELTGAADPLVAIKQGHPWQLDIHAESSRFKASATGNISGAKDDRVSAFDINFDAERLGALANWFGVREEVDDSLRLAGAVNVSDGQISLVLSQWMLGDSSGTAKINWQTKDEGGAANISAHFPNLNLDQIQALWPEIEVSDESDDKTLTAAVTPSLEPGAGPTPGPGPAQGPGPSPATPAAQNSGSTNNFLLPEDINIPDANIDFRIDHLTAGEQTFKAFNLSGEVLDGWLKQSPFSVEFAGSKFYGNTQLDLRNQTVTMDFELAVDQPDFGKIMAELDLVEDLNMSLERAQFTLNLKGKTIQELIQQMRLRADLTGGFLRLTDANTGAATDIKVTTGSITAQPHQRLTFTMEGELKELPIRIEASTLPISRILSRTQLLNVQLSVHIADMSMLSYSTMTLPLDSSKMTLGVIFKTESLAELNPLLDMDLPPYGPFEIHGRFGKNPEGYEMRQSRIKVGDSSLVGEMRLNTLGEKPELDIQLNSPSIQINDFKVGDWKAWAESDENTEQQQESGQTEKPEDQDQAPLLSAETLNRMNARFLLNVDEVLSGDDLLGKGLLKLQLQDGDLTLNPLNIALPGGEIYVNGHLKPVDEGFNVALNTDVDHFDYGVIARRVSPETAMQGEVSFRMDIETTAKTPDDLFSQAQGEFGFALWPRDFEAGIIDLWAIGLATAVLPKLGPGDPSQLNCAVGTFSLDQGQMSDNVLILDTSRMQIAGQSKIDFSQKDLEMILVPRAKTAQIFGLSLPVMVTGKFDDFGFAIPSGELIATTVRFVSSPLVSPLRWLLEQPMEEDGSALCHQLYNKSRQPTPLRLSEQ